MNEDEKRPARLSLREEVRRSVRPDDLNGQMMAAEIFGELPAEHPDSPYADEIKAMRRAWYHRLNTPGGQAPPGLTPPTTRRNRWRRRRFLSRILLLYPTE